MGTSLVSGTVVRAFVVLVVIISGVIVAMQMSSEVRGFVDSINFWKADTVKIYIEELRDVYNGCRQETGDNCLCVSNLNLELKDGSIWVESTGKSVKDYGIWFTPSNLGVPEVQHCLVYTKFDANEPYHDEFDEVAHFDGDLKSEIFFSSQGYIEQRPNKGYKKGAIKSDPVSLFKHVDKQKGVIYLCLVPFSLGGTPTCDEVLKCGYELCGVDAICPNGNVDKNYQGQGECCMQACQQTVSQATQNAAAILYQEGSGLFLNKKYTEAYAKFKEVYENYKDTTVTDGALFKMGEVLIKTNRQEEGLIVWRDLLIEYSGFKDDIYGNSFYAAEQESDIILHCEPDGKEVATKELCLNNRDSLLKGCYWKPDAFWSPLGPDGTCESCDGISCSTISKGNCAEDICIGLGEPYCEWNSPYGKCWYSQIKKTCSAYNNYPLVCKLAVSFDFKSSCEWTGTECVSN